MNVYSYFKSLSHIFAHFLLQLCSNIFFFLYSLLILTMKIQTIEFNASGGKKGVMYVCDKD